MKKKGKGKKNVEEEKEMSEHCTQLCNKRYLSIFDFMFKSLYFMEINGIPVVRAKTIATLLCSSNKIHHNQNDRRNKKNK